jgi:hypothetical protein
MSANPGMSGVSGMTGKDCMCAVTEAAGGTAW